MALSGIYSQFGPIFFILTALSSVVTGAPATDTKAFEAAVSFSWLTNSVSYGAGCKST